MLPPDYFCLYWWLRHYKGKLVHGQRRTGFFWDGTGWNYFRPCSAESNATADIGHYDFRSYRGSRVSVCCHKRALFIYGSWGLSFIYHYIWSLFGFSLNHLKIENPFLAHKPHRMWQWVESVWRLQFDDISCRKAIGKDMTMMPEDLRCCSRKSAQEPPGPVHLWVVAGAEGLSWSSEYGLFLFVNMSF